MRQIAAMLFAALCHADDIARHRYAARYAAALPAPRDISMSARYFCRVRVVDYAYAMLPSAISSPMILPPCHDAMLIR